jgi:hypothetical protein
VFIHAELQHAEAKVAVLAAIFAVQMTGLAGIIQRKPGSRRAKVLVVSHEERRGYRLILQIV